MITKLSGVLLVRFWTIALAAQQTILVATFS
jgi:hypothetical protein